MLLLELTHANIHLYTCTRYASYTQLLVLLQVTIVVAEVCYYYQYKLLRTMMYSVTGKKHSTHVIYVHHACKYC
jgi:hypothetical protein